MIPNIAQLNAVVALISFMLSLNIADVHYLKQNLFSQAHTMIGNYEENRQLFIAIITDKIIANKVLKWMQKFCSKT